jgi:protein tyrosine phosphatase (PTP) superfamily phosphohydrolase (DUF442 family)
VKPGRKLAIIALLAGWIGCSGPAPKPTPDPQPVQADGLHNVFRLSDRLISGSSPEGDAGFAALQQLGVRTIVTVDGAVPDVAAAEKHGMRYVHLPVGYDGIPRDRVLALAKAVRDLPGPVYLHCHHGQHRGPAAAAVVQLCLDPTWTAETAASWMKAAGTDPKYTGLTGLPAKLSKPTSAELDAASSDYPPKADVSDLTRLMVAVDERWDHLKLVKDADWKQPPGHPDIDPPHEALQLTELYREAARLSAVKARGAELLKHFFEAETATNELAMALRTQSPEAAGKAFGRVQSACSSCHAAHRDAPSR